MRYSDDDFDERGILKDGRSVRVSMQMRDAAMSRSGERRQTSAAITDGRSPNDPTALHRPGFRVRTGDARKPTHEARATADKRAGHQWKCGDKEDLCLDCDGEGYIDGILCDTCGGDGVMPERDSTSKGAGKGYGSSNEGGYKGTAGNSRTTADQYRDYDAALQDAWRG
jgi:hypothetical protein